MLMCLASTPYACLSICTHLPYMAVPVYCVGCRVLSACQAFRNIPSQLGTHQPLGTPEEVRHGQKVIN